MTLVLTEEQRFLKDTARDFFSANAPVEALRQLRDSRDTTGYSPDLWQQMVELGWSGVIFPEAYGGLEFGFMGLGAVIEEAGHTLAASPLLASVVLGGSAILLAGEDHQRRELLPPLIEGRLTLALALEEGPHHNPAATALRATPCENGYRLNGHKTFVIDGHSADQLIVVARTSGNPGDRNGLSLFLHPADSTGVNITRTRLVDSRNCANIQFTDVEVTEAALLGPRDNAYDILDAVLDRARICLAAEMLGGAQELFNRTLDYLKERRQFGVVIGSFQALQHRAAKMFAELELARSTVIAALAALDESNAKEEDRAREIATLASLAKAKVSEVYQHISNEALQLHGGIGVTDELEVGFFLKRARVAQQAFGCARFHRNRYAELQGF